MTCGLLDELGPFPEIIRANFLHLIEEHGIEVICEHRIGEVAKDGRRLLSAEFDLDPFDELGCPPVEATRKGNLRVAARVFIDASDKGDLMARAGISCRVDREASETFGEEVAGIREPVELTPIDPFVVPVRHLCHRIRRRPGRECYFPSAAQRLNCAAFSRNSR